MAKVKVKTTKRTAKKVTVKRASTRKRGKVARKDRTSAEVDAKVLFQAGGPGGPGRGKGNVGGRTKALMRLDALLAKSKNLDLLDEALQAEFNADPVLFFKQIVMPLIPRNQVVKLEGAEKLPVRITMPGQSEGVVV